MVLAIIILSILLLLLISYIVCLRKQIQSVNRQLKKRLNDKSRQRVTIELFDGGFNELAETINNCLKAEETLRLDFIREEKEFKEMIANISHDLRTPLTAIKGYQQLLESESLTKEQQKRLKIAQKYADQLGNLIEHFFEYSYLLNAEVKVNFKRINLTNLVVECLMEFVQEFENNHMKVDFQQEAPVFISADEEMTVRIIQNLIRNCLMHSIGDVKVSIISGEDVTLSFINPHSNGQDIDESRIFERFYTGDKTRKNRTGLGLSIVKILVEQMGGSVHAKIDENEIYINVCFLRRD
ncbi:MAG: sensor histidine kinase [Velocimicrobium sp.]